MKFIIPFFQWMKTMLMSLSLVCKRSLAYVCLGFMGCAMAYGQASTDMGTKALQEVTTGIIKYIPYVQNLIYAIAGVVAVIGSIQVYMKMNNGDQDVSKSIMMLVGACLFLVAAAVALPKFFGV